MHRPIALSLALVLGVLVGCDEDEPDHDYIARGEEACVPEYESVDDKPEDAPCHTWACATDEELVCATAIPYNTRCDGWAEKHGCDIDDVIRVSCLQCSNW